MNADLSATARALFTSLSRAIDYSSSPFKIGSTPAREGYARRANRRTTEGGIWGKGARWRLTWVCFCGKGARGGTKLAEGGWIGSKQQYQRLRAPRQCLSSVFQVFLFLLFQGPCIFAFICYFAQTRAGVALSRVGFSPASAAAMVRGEKASAIRGSLRDLVGLVRLVLI